MTKSERNELRKLRKLRLIPVGTRTDDQIRRLIKLVQQDQNERRVHDPIRPREKKP